MSDMDILNFCGTYMSKQLPIHVDKNPYWYVVIQFDTFICRSIEPVRKGMCMHLSYIRQQKTNRKYYDI